MTATDLYKAGRLQAALDAQIQDVKTHPADHGKRLFLFDLAAFTGDMDRVRRQIEAVQVEGPEVETTRMGYRKLLDAEEKRRRLFRDGLTPRFLGEVPEHVKLRLEAVTLLRENKLDEAASLLGQANEALPTLKGKLNGNPFEGLRDADDLLGSVIEVLAQGEYFWVPLEQVECVSSNVPKTPRDLLWMPARLMTREGEQGEVFLPVLYPLTHEETDESLKLGRSTDWRPRGETVMVGVGAKTFLVGDEGVGLTQWRELTLD